MQEPFSDLTQNQPIREVAYEQLKHAIITGQIEAGSRIVETVYAEYLHISRTPLREALQKLEIDGLVEYKPHRGVIVKAFTLSDIEEIYIIRNAMMMHLLPSVVEKVTEKDIEQLRGILAQMDEAMVIEDAESLAVLNRQFHRGIEQLSDKHRILHVIDSQEEYIKRFSAMTIASVIRRTNAHKEHHQMADLLEKRDLEGLMELTRHHLEESKTTCLEAVRNQNRRYETDEVKSKPSFLEK